MTDVVDAPAADRPPIVIEPEMSGEEFEASVDRKCSLPWASKFGALFLDQLDEPGREFEFLIDGFFSIGDRSVVGGKSQSGKSFLAIHAGMCIATGMDFFGAKVKQGLVIYQAGEGARGVKKRLRAWRKHHEVKYGRDTPFVLLQSPVDLWRADGDTSPLIAEIKAIAAMFPWIPLRMIVIDTLATATGGADENSGKDMGLVMQNVAKISAATGAHVCLVHHMNAGGEKLRGHTSVYANIDQVILVTRDEKTKVRTAVLDKQKDGESGQRFQFELMSVELGAGKDGKQITSCVCLPVGEKEAIRRVEENKGFALDRDESIFMRAYFAAEKQFGQPVPVEMDLPATVRSIVSYTEVKRAYVTMNPSDALPEDAATEEEKAVALERHREALKKSLQRLRKKLQGFGVIGIREDKIWWAGKILRGFPQTRPPEEATHADDGRSEPDSGIPF